MLKDFLSKNDEEVKENLREKEKIEVPQEIISEYETLKKYLETNFNCEVELNFHLARIFIFY